MSALLRWHNVTRPVDALGDFVSEFKMVLGAHHERKLLVENNPHLVNCTYIDVPSLVIYMQMNDSLTYSTYTILCALYRGPDCSSHYQLDCMASSVWTLSFCHGTHHVARHFQILRFPFRFHLSSFSCHGNQTCHAQVSTIVRRCKIFLRLL